MARSHGRPQTNFNPRPLAGATHRAKGPSSGAPDFNPRPLAGATADHFFSFTLDQFQSTPPCGGDFKPSISQCAGCYFNPRPLAGATARIGALAKQYLISIHAPLRGRLARTSISLRPLSFQSTPPCGGDPGPLKSTPKSSNFNPRPLAGATAGYMLSNDQIIFQSTPPCGGDASADLMGNTSSRFQSTPPCGGDVTVMESIKALLISIHAPLRGRPGTAGDRPLQDPFQSTPPCGGDLAEVVDIVEPCNFNPRPLAGATKGHTHFGCVFGISIHAPLRGRPTKHLTGALGLLFQSTPPCGGDR